MTVILAYGNRIDDTTTLSGGAWESAYPRPNLADYRLSKIARTANALTTSTLMRFALADPQYIGLVGLMATNASVEAAYQVRLFSDSGFTTVQYDSGTLDLYPMGTIPQGQIPWGAPNWWTGRPLPEEIARFQRNIAHRLTTAQYAQYGEIKITDTANADGYLQAGRLFVGQVFSPRYGLQTGKASQQLTPRTQVQAARDGTPYFQRERAAFSMPFSLDALTDDEAARVLDLQATVDLEGEVFMAWDANKRPWAFRRQLFGRLKRLDPIEHPSFALRSAAFQVEGIL